MVVEYDKIKKAERCPKCEKETEAILHKREDGKGEYRCLICGTKLVEFELK